MTETPPLDDLEDAAWAVINTPLSVDELLAFCQDVECLFRINPQYEFKQWKPQADGRVHWQARNISQQPSFEIDTILNITREENAIRVEYDGGIKDSTWFRVEPGKTGSRLTLIDRYESLGPDEREARLNEVDRSLANWAQDIQAYLVRWNKWSWLTPWRWYMRRVWCSMKPSGRRIAYMLWWISVAELAIIMLAVGIYWAEYA